MNGGSDPDRSGGAQRVDEALLDAIGSLGDRTRLEILFALAEAERDREAHRYSLSFTELYEAVDVDSSSRFAYHLGRLVGPFVAETDEGYRLTYVGDRIVRAVRSGTYERPSPSAFESVAVDGACLFCGCRDLRADLDDDRFVVRCDGCGTTLVSDFFPRSQARERTPAEIAASFGARIWSIYVLVRGGLCPECYGRVGTSVDAWSADDHDPAPDEEGPDEPAPDETGPDRSGYVLVGTCTQCRLAVSLPIEVAAAFHPAAIGFFWDHGISLLDVPLWEFFAFLADDVVTVEVAAVDPFDAAFEIALDGETLRLTMDDELSVTPVE